MDLKNTKFNKKANGFTIVELLVVIVVIGILAAITIVSYTGVTARANKAAAQSTANSVVKKAEVYYIDGGTNLFPDNLGKLTVTATADKAYYLSGVTFNGADLNTTNNKVTKPSEINYYRCGTGATDTAPVAPVTNITAVTGAQVGYWDYTADSLVKLNIGNTSTAVGTKAVGCIITTAIGT